MTRGLLLDTHVFLWALSEPRRLGALRAELENRDNPVFVSAASIWEIAIKRALGKLESPPGIASMVNEVGFEELAITCSHADAAGDLPPLHRDPFDRMLVAQAALESLTLVTHDGIFDSYEVDTILV